MPMPVSTIRNLGPAAQTAFARAGIHDAETLRAIGADSAYARLLASGASAHFIGYYALVMGLQGRPWNDCRGDEKAALRQRFDRLKAAATQRGAGRDAGDGAPAPAALERILDRIGIRGAGS